MQYQNAEPCARACSRLGPRCAVPSSPARPDAVTRVRWLSGCRADVIGPVGVRRLPCDISPRRTDGRFEAASCDSGMRLECASRGAWAAAARLTQSLTRQRARLSAALDLQGAPRAPVRAAAPARLSALAALPRQAVAQAGSQAASCLRRVAHLTQRVAAGSAAAPLLTRSGVLPRCRSTSSRLALSAPRASRCWRSSSAALPSLQMLAAHARCAPLLIEFTALHRACSQALHTGEPPDACADCHGAAGLHLYWRRRVLWAVAGFAASPGCRQLRYCGRAVHQRRHLRRLLLRRHELHPIHRRVRPPIWCVLRVSRQRKAAGVDC